MSVLGEWTALRWPGIEDADVVRVTPPYGTPVTRAESDEDLRQRLAYVAGDTADAVARIRRAGGAELDAIAEEHGLRRRVGGR